MSRYRLLPLWHPASATKSRTGAAALISDGLDQDEGWRVAEGGGWWWWSLDDVVVRSLYHSVRVIIAPPGITCSVWTDGTSCSTCHKHKAALSPHWTSSIVPVRCLALVRAGDWCALGETGCFGGRTAKREGPFLSLRLFSVVNKWSLLHDQYWRGVNRMEMRRSTVSVKTALMSLELKWNIYH